MGEDKMMSWQYYHDDSWNLVLNHDDCHHGPCLSWVRTTWAALLEREPGLQPMRRGRQVVRWGLPQTLLPMIVTELSKKWNDKMYHQERLTSESLQSLYDVENGEKPEADRQIHRWEIRNCTFWCEITKSDAIKSSWKMKLHTQNIKDDRTIEKSQSVSQGTSWEEQEGRACEPRIK